ncbi:MAG TPA: TadG family pilus assembly protein [Verrucomicrobiae bacterium]|nr:TadG family pilus assembly protein [Verrucomicrobiae bacterium]
MSKRVRRIPRQESRGKNGSTLVLVTVSMVALFGFTALSIDVARAYKEKRHEQFGTDAGAFAAVVMLNTNLAASTAANNASLEAANVAGANGVTSSEITSGGGIQVGRWANGQFFPNQTTNGVYTAVRVQAKRNVGMQFAKVVGLSSMSPTVHSTADLEGAGRVANAVPFGVSVDQVTNHTYGDTMLLNDITIGSGKQGKVYLAAYQDTPAWYVAMTGSSGCGCETSVGTIPTKSGNGQVDQAFNALGAGAILVMPVVDQFSFSGNSGQADILGFVIVKLLNSSGTGNNWSANVQFLATVIGDGGGGNCPPPCAQTRLIVQ